MCDAAKYRRELISAGLTGRRDLSRDEAAHGGRDADCQDGLSARAIMPLTQKEPPILQHRP
jgi:hypothetical protein